GANRFEGSDPHARDGEIPTWASVKYEGVYPGIDLVYYGSGSGLEYDLVLGPRADPERIALEFAAHPEAVIDGAGELSVEVPGWGKLRHQRPHAFQDDASARRQVSAAYVWRDCRHVGLRLGPYDRNLPLRIDPVLTFSTYLGGS